MPDLPSASAVLPAASAAPVSSANNIVVETTVNNVPDKIQQLSRQIEVSGTLAEAPAGNSITLNTMVGPLTLLLPQMAQMQQDKLLQQLITLFQNQRPLMVVMQPGNPPSQAFLLLPSLGSVASSQTNAANVLPLPPGMQAAAPSLQPNTVLSAIVLPGSAGTPFLTTGQAGQVPYAALNPLLIAAGNAPAATALQTPEAPLPAAAAAPPQAEELNALPTPSQALQAIAIPAGANTAPPPAPSLFQSGAELTLSVNAVMLPNAPAGAAPMQPQAPNEFLATVVGGGPGGQIILKTGDTSLFVRQPTNLPVGTQLLVTAEPAKTNAAALLTLPDIEQLPALQQVVSALAQIDPAAARAIMAMRVPQPGEGLPGGLLFFLSAIRQGDMRSWLGNGAVDLLTRAGKAELIGKLAQELEQPGEAAHDNVVGAWRAYTVPLHDNGQFGVLHLYVHGERERQMSRGGKENAKTGGDPTQMRFLIDMRMSRLGVMQLDGFLRPKKLDIIMRSEHALPMGLDNELRTAYAKTLGAIGYNGALAFQTGRQGWLHIRKPAAGQAVVT